MTSQTPNGAETINGVAAAVVTTAVIANAPSVTVMADPNNTTNWIAFARS